MGCYVIADGKIISGVYNCDILDHQTNGEKGMYFELFNHFYLQGSSIGIPRILSVFDICMITFMAFYVFSKFH